MGNVVRVRLSLVPRPAENGQHMVIYYLGVKWFRSPLVLYTGSTLGGFIGLKTWCGLNAIIYSNTYKTMYPWCATYVTYIMHILLFKVTVFYLYWSSAIHVIFKWCLCLTWYTKPLCFHWSIALKSQCHNKKHLAEKVPHTSIWVLYLVVLFTSWGVGGMAEATGHSTIARYISITDSQEASTGHNIG